MKEKNKLLIQIIKFIMVGGSATILDWLLYYVLYNYLNVSPLIANVLSYSISTIYNYFMSVKCVFNVNDKYSKKKAFTIFIILSLIGLLLSELLIYIMIDKLNMNKMLSKIISTILVMIFNFITKKRFLENKKS